MKISGVFAAAVAASFLAGAASAATLSLAGATTDNSVTGNFLGYTSVDYIAGNVKSAANGLSVSGPAKVTYTYLGKEAGNTNYAADVGGIFFNTASTTVGATHVATQLLAGLLNFAFGTSAPNPAIGVIANDGVANPASSNYAIGYVMLTASSYVLLFDDIASGDRDFDDIAVRVDVEDLAPVPVPAAGVLLLGAIAGLGAVARKRRAA